MGWISVEAQLLRLLKTAFPTIIKAISAWMLARQLF